MGGDNPVENNFVRVTQFLGSLVEDPVVWFRKKIVEPNQKDYSWYHQKFRRVPTIDECYTDDPLCKFEANQQFRRDRMVDSEILNILRQRFEDCVTYEAPDHKTRCLKLKEMYDEANTNWFIKYGDLGAYGNAEKALAKQKHRLIWERRYGPVGSGKGSKNDKEVQEQDE
ncbi:NADH dehydrogenase [ubiquinone] 1 beta subcomplex subunit 10 [Halyomorpha halys]|uniref:NADH dehydrogenase [ubiquinone] 1 beta subcomplex subunit 10 n=1 Tax=Halyomorpha halys TaxID=286706 RepID=UPI0006D4D621|nr:NADH dehydrogenase [ubiquinone] 1 beta subcomplex subunit 10 [Halyomorpha halys]